MSSVRSRSAPPNQELLFDNCICASRQVCCGSSEAVNHAALDPGLRSRGRKEEERRDQATKGTRWMPRRQEAKKDVGSCEKRRGAANQALIRRCPNGETHGG